MKKPKEKKDGCRLTVVLSVRNQLSSVMPSILREKEGADWKYDS